MDSGDDTPNPGDDTTNGSQEGGSGCAMSEVIEIISDDGVQYELSAQAAKAYIEKTTHTKLIQREWWKQYWTVVNLNFRGRAKISSSASNFAYSIPILI
jgi:hypothetical protein